MVNNARDLLEQPVVRHIPKHVHAFWDADLVSTKSTPSFRDESALSRLLYSIKDKFCHCIRIIDNDRTEPNVYWRRAAL